MINEEGIIKALECYAVNKDFDEIQCAGCAFETRGICLENCSEGLAQSALDLINRQKAEIERLKEKLKHSIGTDNTKENGCFPFD